ncbi:3-deoxy-D-manno-octulosonic acid transferase [Aureispira anguillae]|uniref:3-deoxy-D-manno-octulosonic acid transferase n=1 Tax=Aureispira anguillae TaxID=2864201 RepID=A0A916DUX9_9BACT|nr:glycosyltransferase N-terminal domain-containing protein [Aureispira anguillae]BDS13137.1 3-deoxy-D-manno-octulosonic acid transferase [Aureispira anguillae]
MAKLLYYLGVFLYKFTIHFVAFLGNTKAKNWVNGRKDIFKRLKQTFEKNRHPVIWIHCASLGEFEQGRPLIERLNTQFPSHKILLTFFSPSGYLVQKDYNKVDWVFYLPADSPKHAAQFISIVQPQQAIFVKYEFWYYYLMQLQAQQIPTYLISAIFRPNQPFFRWYGTLFRQMIGCFQHIFVQNEASLLLLKQIGYQRGVIAGDTRLDRVLAIKKQAKTFPILDAFCQKQYTLVCGSTWPADEAVLADFFQQFSACKLVIAPHQIDNKHLQQIEELFQFTNCLRYSQQATADELAQASVLIIDNIGMLSSIYAYADLAYIGGGFGLGIHNILEAAVFEIPVLFGSNYQKFQEAKDLIEAGVAFEISHAKDMLYRVQQLQQTAARAKIQQQVQQYINQHSGATQVILKHLD